MSVFQNADILLHSRCTRPYLDHSQTSEQQGRLKALQLAELQLGLGKQGLTPRLQGTHIKHTTDMPYKARHVHLCLLGTTARADRPSGGFCMEALCNILCRM